MFSSNFPNSIENGVPRWENPNGEAVRERQRRESLQPYYRVRADDPDIEEEEDAGGWGEDTVDVRDAEKQYTELRRELTAASLSYRGTVDPTSDNFDLDEYFNHRIKIAQREGWRKKRVGIVFKDVTVKGAAPQHSHIPTAATPFLRLVEFFNPVPVVRHLMGTSPPLKKERVILNKISGFCKDREMVLVLGRPGSGCSTLLRVLANDVKSFKSVSGEISYGGISFKEFGKRYRGELAYNQEDDVHFPTLTVQQTLDFALKTKTPGKRLPETTKRGFVKNLINLYGRMFGLTLQMGTLVGNQWIRGLSGGERKRVSIAEQMSAGSAINLWDGSTRGLDASSALDYVRSLRIMTDLLHKATMSSIYQASESIYNLFDKVLLLDEGRCIYFGPTFQAKAYFEELGFECPPRQTTADFLTAITLPTARHIRAGVNEHTVPKSPEDFERAYLESDIRAQMMREMEEYEKFVEEDKPQEDFRKEIREAKRKHQSEKSPYTTTFIQQTKACLQRQFQLIFGDKAALAARYASIYAKAIIVGSAFFRLPLTATGAFERGGVIFFSLLFNALVAQSELVSTFTGRLILYKQKKFAMYHPAAHHIAQVVSDIPLMLVQILGFSVILYFMAGLAADAGKFFLHVFIIFMTSLCMTAFFRMCGALSKSFDVASRYSGVALLALILYTGYMIPENKMHPWFVWIYWINPLAYSFKALLSNEFRGETYQCEGTYLVPYGPTYNDITHQTCTMAGGHSGSNTVDGADYLYASYGYRVSDLGYDVLAVVLFWLLFVLITSVATERIEFGLGGYSAKMFKKTNRGDLPATPRDEESTLNEVEMAAVRQQNSGRVTTQSDEKPVLVKGTTFTWNRINYTVPLNGVKEGKQLLHNITGWVKPGTMTALMGSSGAGKTTLLDTLSQRKTIGKVEGEVLLNHKPLNADFQRITGYCEQLDVHNSCVTVREALQFSAYLRQPGDVSIQEKNEYVEQMLQLLEMESIADALVGDPDTGVGISVEERKRLTIGCELVAKPLLLFLDEPTSGLDSQAAYNIVRFLRKLADNGQTILCTIHQPSSELFLYFDSLLLLARGGKTVYFGEIGKDSTKMLSYFERNGAPACAPNANPAEYILDVVGAGINGKSDKDWTAIWATSPEAQATQNYLNELNSHIPDSNGEPREKPREYATSEWNQLYYVMKRMFISMWRSPSYLLGRVFLFTIIGLLNGFSFFQVGNNVADLQSRLFTIFQSLVLPTLVINTIQPRFAAGRNLFRREHAGKYYGWRPFWLSIVFAELPFLVFDAVLFFCVQYFTVRFFPAPDRAGYYLLMYIVLTLFAASLGQMIQAATPTVPTAAVLNPFFISMLNLFCGVVIPVVAMPAFWRAWLYWLDPYHYLVEGMITNELVDLPITCASNEFSYFQPPSGQTCAQYTSTFFQYATGYIQNPEATSDCMYCQYKIGKEFYSAFGWDFNNRWRNFGILVAYWVFNILIIGVFVRIFRNARR